MRNTHHHRSNLTIINSVSITRYLLLNISFYHETLDFSYFLWPHHEGLIYKYFSPEELQLLKVQFTSHIITRGPHHLHNILTFYSDRQTFSLSRIHQDVWTLTNGRHHTGPPGSTVYTAPLLQPPLDIHIYSSHEITVHHWSQLADSTIKLLSST